MDPRDRSGNWFQCLLKLGLEEGSKGVREMGWAGGIVLMFAKARVGGRHSLTWP